MKITIDTKEDSHHEIQKAITLLQSLISGKVRSSNIFEDTTPTLPTTNSEPSSAGLFNMFASSDSEQEKKPVSESSEVKKEIPRVMEY